MTGEHRADGVVPGGSTRLAALSADARELLEGTLAGAPHGLALGYLPDTGEFAQTVRGVTTPEGVRVRPEGTNLRYLAMATLGLARVPEDVQRATMGGRTAREVVEHGVTLAGSHPDPGAVALVAWAAVEVCDEVPQQLFDRLRGMLASGDPLPTVDVSWMLTAATVAHGRGEVEEVARLATARLLEHQGARGIFPHWLPPTSQPRWRSHVGCFADQVYPIQALARASVTTGDRALLEAAEQTAARICELQGDTGQWWWHYDFRTGDVVEGFPVYSVHQHAMAPMVLLDLADAGGRSHLAEVERGVLWLRDHPEAVEELISERHGLVWRKIGRREPPKAARGLNAVLSSLRPGLRVPAIDRVMPPGPVDHECRPYELGWMLYAWLPAPGAPDA